MFVIADDFDVLPFNLPNLKDENGDTIEGFDAFVVEQEELALRAILGDVFYEAFVLGLAAPSPDQRWLDLKNGKDYDDQDNKLRKWRGMKDLLRPLIYSLWTRYRAGQNSGIGVVVADAENSVVSSSNIEIVNGQNLFMNKAGSNEYQRSTLYQFLFLSGDTYVPDVATEFDNIKEYIEDNWEWPGFENEFDF